MSSRPRRVRREPESALSTSTAGTEEARAFFQSRLSTFGLAMFLLAGGSWTALALVHVLLGNGGAPHEYGPFSITGSLHLAGSLLAAALWLGTRGRPLSPFVLDSLDICATLALTATFSGAAGMSPDPVVAVFVSLLTFNTAMLTRAIVIPSSARRSLVIGLLGAAAVLGIAACRTGPGTNVVANMAPAVCWASVGVAIGTLASHTIFGLRREVFQASMLGQYRLESRIGQGGMGEVWRASHALLRRPTAIKLLPPERMGEEAIRRFEREVQLTARLTHPNTVAIYDYGRTRDGIFYYAMELLDGTTLEELVIRHGPQPAGRVVHVMSQICGALAEAHDLGLVHRDVKPANILLSPRKGEHEFAKILDFGLVKSIETGGDLVGITAVNAITGTPLYIAPEAIRTPGSVDARSDLYGLGAVTWFLLVGRPPFQGRTILDVCSQHLHTAPARPSEVLGRSIPADLEEAVLACLAKRPEDRPQDGRALRLRLLASSAAGTWTPDDAAAWWRERPPNADAAHAPALARTIALDVSTRGEQVQASASRSLGRA